MKRGITFWAVVALFCFGNTFYLANNAISYDCEQCGQADEADYAHNVSKADGDFRVWGEFHAKGWASVDNAPLVLEKGLETRGNANMYNDLRVHGETHLKGWASVDNAPLVLEKGLETRGNANMYNDLRVYGETHLKGWASVDNSDLFLEKGLKVRGNVDVYEGTSCWSGDLWTRTYLEPARRWCRENLPHEYAPYPPGRADLADGNQVAVDVDAVSAASSAAVKIQCSGQSVLSKGTAIIPFDEVFANSADETKPIIVLVTPTNAACKGIAVVKTGINEQYNRETVSGFCALELNGGRSNATFNWQAIGTAKVE